MLAMVASWATLSVAEARVIVVTPQMDLRAAIITAQADDSLRLTSGVHRLSSAVAFQVPLSIYGATANPKPVIEVSGGNEMRVQADLIISGVEIDLPAGQPFQNFIRVQAGRTVLNDVIFNAGIAAERGAHVEIVDSSFSNSASGVYEIHAVGATMEVRDSSCEGLTFLMEYASGLKIDNLQARDSHLVVNRGSTAEVYSSRFSGGVGNAHTSAWLRLEDSSWTRVNLTATNKSTLSLFDSIVDGRGSAPYVDDRSPVSTISLLADSQLGAVNSTIVGSDKPLGLSLSTRRPFLNGDSDEPNNRSKFYIYNSLLVDRVRIKSPSTVTWGSSFILSTGHGGGLYRGTLPVVPASGYIDLTTLHPLGPAIDGGDPFYCQFGQPYDVSGVYPRVTGPTCDLGAVEGWIPVPE